ncbi:MAG: tape measure protein [Rhizobiales bacterium]|nr:tape measure protein [Hyphomicrobiales bacterium]
MAVEVERMIAVLEARINQYEKNLDRARRTTNSQFSKIETRGTQMQKRLEAAMATAGGTIAKVFAGYQAARWAVSLSDAAARVSNALKVAGLEGDTLSTVYERLYQSAQKNAAPFETLATLYARAAQNQKELGVSTEDLLKFTDNVALALRVAGTDAQTASGALLQLGQALGSGRVQAEEFNSVLEGAPTIVQAAAAGIKEAGGSVATLKKLVIEGKVSSAAFFQGFAAGAVILEQKVAGAQITVAQGWTRIENAAIKAAGQFNEGSAASAELARALKDLAGAIEDLGNWFTHLAGPLQTATDLMNQFYGSAKAAGEALGDAMGTTGNRIDRTFQTIQPGISGPRQNSLQTALDAAAAKKATDLGVASTTKVNPVSLADFKVPGGDSADKAAARRAEAWKRETEALQDRDQQIALDISLLGQSTYAVEKHRAQLDLEQAAARAGVPITAERRNQIEQLAEQYGILSQRMQDASIAQQQADQAAADAYGAVKDGLMDVISGTATWEEALAGVLSRLAEIAASNALDALLAPSSGGSSGGGLGSIFAALGKILTGGFAAGGYTGAGGRNQPAGVVHRGEYVMSKAAVDRIGVGRLDALHSSLKGYAMGGYVGTPQIAAPSRGGVMQIALHQTIDLKGANGDETIRKIASDATRQAAPAILEAARRSLPKWTSDYSTFQG